MICNLCPRKCNKERTEISGEGYCRMPQAIKVSRIAKHYWEEPCISGKNGTAAVFFTGCTMGCIYCQNKEISQDNLGKYMTVEEVGNRIRMLLGNGAETLSFITPTHYIDKIIKIIEYVKPNVPVVYNTGGYELENSLKRLRGYIDIYLPDLKYSNNSLGKEYSKVNDYFTVAKTALAEMVNQTGPCIFNDNGILKKGTVVRNLVLPNHTQNSIDVIQYLGETYGDKILFSLMGQYIPYGDSVTHRKLGRKITKREYQKVLTAFENSGLDGFYQELSSADEKYIPKWEYD